MHVHAYLELFTTLEQLAVHGQQASEILTRIADCYRKLDESKTKDVGDTGSGRHSDEDKGNKDQGGEDQE